MLFEHLFVFILPFFSCSFFILSNLFYLNTDKNLGHCDKVLYHQSLLLFQHCPKYCAKGLKLVINSWEICVTSFQVGLQA